MGRGEREEEDKGRKKGGTWQVVAVGVGGGVCIVHSEGLDA